MQDYQSKMSTKNISHLIVLFCILLVILNFVNCRKQNLITNSSAKLDFSTDTVLFDTIFTTIGSTTKYFKLYNNNNGKINISSVQLASGTNSSYRINVNGEAGVNFEDIELEQGDSIFVFVEVTIDPNNSNNPLVVEDSILFLTNGNLQKVVLNAWGQDAYFHVKEIINQNSIWNNDKPHVIYNYCIVDSSYTLTIPAGTEVRGHSNSILYVYKSALQVNGTLGEPVTFKQDRTEDFLLYDADSTSGQWRGIWFFQPLNSSIEYANISNAIIGIQVDTAESGNLVQLNSVAVQNSLYASILTQGANVNAVNCLFGNSSQFCGFISLGGEINFEHCTFGNYWQGQRNSALFVLKDYYNYQNIPQPRPFSAANFTNCIFYGSNSNEVVIDTLSRELTSQNPVMNFTNSLLKLEDSINSSVFFNNCFNNLNPEFNDPVHWDFSIPSTSFVIDKGAPSTILIDLIGTSRTNGNDLGCFEHI